MAQTPYAGGVPTVAPDVRPPDDFQHVQATPEAFGGAIAHGLQEAGQGAVKSSQFYGQVASDDATNQLFDRWNKRMYGDPTKQVLQPDGTMGQDTGFMGLRGRAALDARPGLESAMEADMDEIRKNLTTPEQQLAFDRDSRRYRIGLQQHLGQHADSQFTAWGSEVNKAAGQTALTTIANTAYDDETFQHAKADLINARVKDAQLAGGGDDLVNAAVQRGTQEAWKSRLETISVKDPALAAQLAEKNQKELGTLYEPLAQQFRSRTTQAVGIGAANYAISSARSGAIQPPPPGSAADARIYLQGLTAHPGRIGDTSYLHPEFAQRLAGAIKEARANGLDVSMMSGYRDANATGSRYDAEGWSLHDKGAAADINGLDGAGGPKTQQWAQIAARHGLSNPYGINNAAEFNHWQLIPDKLENRPDIMSGVRAARGNMAAEWNAIMPVSGGTGGGIVDAVHKAIIGQESSGNPNEPPSVNGAMGIGQIKPETFAQYAKPGERISNPADNLAVSKRIVADLAQKFGNDPDRIAVGYFSGAGNVAPPGSTLPWKHDWADGNGKLVSSYVADIQKRLQGGQSGDVHYAALRQVGGDNLQTAGGATGTANPSLPGQPQVDEAPPMPSATPAPPEVPQAPQPPTPEQLKAAAYRAISENENLSREEKEHAYTEINRQIAEQQIIDQANEKAQKEANEKAANGYVTRILNGNGGAGIIRQIANDPALKWETKEHLVEAVKKHSGSDVEEAKLAYGPGFWGAYKAVTAAPGDPSRIADPTQLLSRAGPGGDLTLAGVQKLSQTLQQNQKSVNDQAVNTTKVGLLNYAKSKFSFDQEMMFPGVPPLKDPKGQAIFEGQFIPKFEAAYDQWTKDGKDPWQFLTQKNVDAMVEGMRPKSQMAMDRVVASGEGAPPDPNAKLPPAPAGVEPNAWSKVVAVPPPMENGKPFPYAAWGHAVSMLLAAPTPENIKLFNESKFGKAGIDGKYILDQLHGKASPNTERVANPFGGGD
jgi:hypothetical protein